jgi:hypothetical protein
MAPEEIFSLPVTEQLSKKWHTWLGVGNLNPSQYTNYPKVSYGFTQSFEANAKILHIFKEKMIASFSDLSSLLYILSSCLIQCQITL